MRTGQHPAGLAVHGAPPRVAPVGRLICAALRFAAEFAAAGLLVLFVFGD